MGSENVMCENLVRVGDKFIRPSAVVSIEPSTFGACWVTLAVQHTGSKPHRVYVDMPPEKVAKALGLVA